MSNPINDILKLSVEERVNIVEKIWDSIDDNSLPVTDEEITIARERHNEYIRNPNDLVSWEKVKNELIKKYSF